MSNCGLDCRDHGHHVPFGG